MGLDVSRPDLVACKQQRCRPACAYAQSDQRFVNFLYLESIVVDLAPCKISIVWLVSVDEHGWPEDRFSRDEAK